MCLVLTISLFPRYYLYSFFVEFLVGKKSRSENWKLLSRLNKIHRSIHHINSSWNVISAELIKVDLCFAWCSESDVVWKKYDIKLNHLNALLDSSSIKIFISTKQHKIKLRNSKEKNSYCENIFMITMNFKKNFNRNSAKFNSYKSLPLDFDWYTYILYR